VPLSKIISFDAARCALSNDIFKIVISKTNVDIQFEKRVKQASKEIFHCAPELVPLAKHIPGIKNF
jgi:hypothetical protein